MVTLLTGKGLRVFIFMLVLVIPWGPVSLGHGEEVLEKPVLRVETGMHTAVINRIGIDKAERFLVTGSNDKTVRVWELPTGRLLKVLRPPLGRGNVGKIYAVAISPDGEKIACGGWTNNENLYIFDRPSGTLKRQIRGLPNVTFHLSYSRDGRYLAASLWGANGLRIYRTTDYKEVKKDDSYGDSSYWSDWDEAGRLVTTCLDGYIRLYGSNLQLLAKKKARGGKEPFAATFCPDGSLIAVGFSDSTKIDILSGEDLDFQYEADTSPVNNGNFFSVFWSRDGKALFAAGRYDQKGVNPILRWQQRGKGKPETLDGPLGTVMHLLPLSNGGVAFGAGDPAFGLLDRMGKRILFVNSKIADFRAIGNGFRVSHGGSGIQFAYKIWGKEPSQFTLKDRRLNAVSKDNGQFVSPVTRMPGLDITDWKNNFFPKLNGTKLPLKKYERTRSLAIAPDGRTFLLGTSWNLRLFDRQGKEQWRIDTPGDAWAVNITGNGKLAAAAFSDGTIRWYRLKDGQELLTFFPHNDQKRWVLWTPSGYYDASPGGEELIGWHVNRGPDKAADFFSVSRFRDSRYRPDVVARVLDTLGEEKALLSADNEAQTRQKETDILKRLPPVITILSPADGAAVSTQKITLAYSLRNPSGEPITAVKIRIDGRPLPRQRRIIPVKKENTGSITFTIPPKDCRISLIAENRFAAGEPDSIRLTWKLPPLEELKPKLYVLAIGVTHYQDPSLKLLFPAKDARDFETAIKKQKGGLYADVITRLLTDREATKGNILDGLAWLEKQVTAKDVSMVFLAGHGENDHKGTYYFFPVNVDTKRLKRTGVSFLDIKDTVANVPGKSLLFADTCHSGNIMGSRRGGPDINALVNELISAENGVVVFTASSSREYALENETWSKVSSSRGGM